MLTYCALGGVDLQIAVILITGGEPELTSVEVLASFGIPHNCTVPPLPASRHSHTQDGAVACGGSGVTATRTSCVSLTASGWTTSHQLVEGRVSHVSWLSPAGLLLMGGRHSDQTTELLTDTGSSSPSFDLEYDTW